jgi:hypothetical protein
MLDWSERIDDVMDYLRSEWAIEDRGAVETLLSALINCPRTPAVWMIIETNWYSRHCLEAWFAFGGWWVPYSLGQIRARQPWREIVAQLQEWLDSPSDERLLVEPDWERYPYYNRLYNALYILDRALRVRTVSRHTTANLVAALDKETEERRNQGLWERARAALEDRTGARPAAPPRFVEPAHFAYYTELLTRLSPWYRDWQALVQALGCLAVRHAYLYGRTETNADDLAIVARVIAAGVPPWIKKAVEILGAGPSKSYTLEYGMGLTGETRRSDRGNTHELARLRRRGLIRFSSRQMSWSIAEEHRQGMLDVVAGKIFTPGTLAATG